jgi:UDP-2,3-diacylglucosamine pyrophosphatase LpxH
MTETVQAHGVSGANGQEQSGPHGAARYRAIFLSDIHLGTRACQADALLDFLKYHEADVIYLAGDIIDFWRVRRGPIWLQSHNDVIQKVLRKVRKGTRVIYIPGNHDEALRSYCGMNFGGIEIHHDFFHTTADGKRLWVMHGDEFDVIVRYAKWLAFLGDRSYEFALWCNFPLNWARRKFGLGYWSLSGCLKLKVKAAVSFIGEFEEALAEEAKRRGVDGIVCGHIHHASDRPIGGVRYLNCGDWVESRTAIAEDQNGHIRVIHWRETSGRAMVEAAQTGYTHGSASTPALAAYTALPEMSGMQSPPAVDTNAGGWTQSVEKVER